MTDQIFTIKTLEDLIRFFKSLAHEPKGKPVPAGVARSYQTLLENARRKWKAQAAANKAKKNRKANSTFKRS
jgi:hypothetical protein